MKVKTHNAIIRLSKNAEREQRIPIGFKKAKASGQNAYERPMLAGAYFLNEETMICNGFYALIIHDIIDGLQMVEGQGEYIDCNKFITPEITRAVSECQYTPTDEEFTKINKAKYQTKYVKMLLDCFEDYTLYNDADNDTSPLIIKNQTSIAILMPVRPDKKESK